MNITTPHTQPYWTASGALWLLKDTGRKSPVIVPVVTPVEIERGFQRIRCPLCFWQPQDWDLWCCMCLGTPEPFFEGCGTEWNTFTTRGRCPGCQHQWKWTGCLRCGVASLHEDWYEQDDAR